MAYLPESTRLLYSQLLSQCLNSSAPRGRGLSFVTKQIKGGKHWYLQLTVGSRKTQHYLGPDNSEVRLIVQQETALWESAAPDASVREQLIAMLAKGGAYTANPVDARVFELLERTGVFLVGGTIVGSHAFALYGNMLGIQWASETTRTQDIAAAHVVIGVPDRKVDLHRALIESELGFIEIPALDLRSPSTKFRIRGKQISVDILTPMLGRTSSKPILLKSLNVHAEPVRFLEYLLTDTQPAVIAAKAGLLVNVPAPGRYALHKLVLAQRRVAAFQTKQAKDIDQAEQLILALAQDRPGDLRTAWLAAQKQPTKFIQQLNASTKKISKEAGEALRSITSTARRK